MCTTIQSCFCATKKYEIESRLGIRYSDLLRLPYFDVIRYHLIDPMHNLFLGTAKNVVNLWKEEGINKMLENLQEVVNCINVPFKIGRIPIKISSGFSDFTADQSRHWTALYSPLVLYEKIPDNHYQLWCLFSKACSLLSRPFIATSEVIAANKLLFEFCRTFQHIFGKQAGTPNMHMHADL